MIIEYEKFNVIQQNDPSQLIKMYLSAHLSTSCCFQDIKHFREIVTAD